MSDNGHAADLAGGDTTVNVIDFAICARCHVWQARYHMLQASGFYERTCVNCLTPVERARIDAYRRVEGVQE